MPKCGCRWNCDHHEATYQWRHGHLNGALDLAGFCPTPAAECYCRFICPNCGFTQVTQNCLSCQARIERWLATNSGVHCESCGVKTNTQLAWTLYKDVSV